MVILLSANHKNSNLQIVLISPVTFTFQFRLNILCTTLFQLGDLCGERQLNSFPETFFRVANPPNLPRQICM